ncbi:MAG: PEP-CTERM-box response regulator transcription factor [Akkermansiaceae bacterium]|nr:PEP-CTERM-box response regulator transcription factor [Akkermansiaceae bacterium]
MKPKILIIDDDEEIRTQMKWAVVSDYDVALAGDGVEAIERFRSHKPQVVLLDLGLPPSPNDTQEGMAILAALLTLNRSVKIIIVSGQSDRENAMRAIGAGAYDFLSKPVDIDHLRVLLQRSIFVSELESEYRQLQNEERPGIFEGIMGSSDKMEGVFKTVEKVAKVAAPVLILGESGTGKEMVATAIHRRSALKDKPFVAINCNAIPESLIESELFGYEKGSFTGANTQKIGLIESAAGGTLFLDEIGDLPAAVQVKMLRFLQEKCIQRVGGRQEILVDVRVLAATHVDLIEAVKDGRFREDLYFRLAVVTCKLPPLRERGDDVALLAQDFLQRFGKQNGREDLSFDSEALSAIVQHSWPGNVRELQNRIQRGVIMADGGRITCEDLELTGSFDAEDGAVSQHAWMSVDLSQAGGLKEARETLDRELVHQALERNDRNITAAAKDLNVSRPTLYELMVRLGIPRG